MRTVVCDIGDTLTYPQNGIIPYDINLNSLQFNLKEVCLLLFCSAIAWCIIG